MAEKKIIRDQNGRSSDSSAHWQAEKDRSAAKSRANNSGGSGGGSRQGGGVQGGGSTPQASKPVSGTGRQAKSKSPGDSSAYWLRKLEQDTLNIRKRGLSRSASGARGSSPSRRSGVPAHQSGSFLSLNASNATKRNLMELELGKLQEEAARVTGARQRDALSRRQSNVLHQLDFLDAAEGKAPRPHTVAGVPSGNGTQSPTGIGYPAANFNSAGGRNITALGAAVAMTKADEQSLKDLQARYEKNLAIEKEGLSSWLDPTGHINGQAREGLGEMSFGPTIDEKRPNMLGRAIPNIIQDEFAHHPFGTVENAGCESIAVYNTLHDLGKDVSLSQIIYDTERNNYTLWNGWFGTKTSKVDDVLKLYGVESKAVSIDNIQKAADSGKEKEGQIYVASIWNDKTTLLKGYGGIHTFEIVYSPKTDPDKPWTVYNRGSEDKAASYASLDDILTYKETTGKYRKLNQVID